MRTRLISFIVAGFLIGALATFGSTRVGVSVKHVSEPSFGEGDSQFVLKRQLTTQVLPGVVGSKDQVHGRSE